MDAALKEKWVKALRSGEYEQGTDIFEHGGKYCCLGVLAAVVADGRGPLLYPMEIITPEERWQCIKMNDGLDDDGPRSFLEIADHIEANIPGE